MLDKTTIADLKRECRERGMNPDQPPEFTERYSPGELAARLAEYEEVIGIIRHFVDKFLSVGAEAPMMIAITDDAGYVLAFQGNPAMIGTVNRLGIVEGVRFNEASGVNAISLCLDYRQPVQLMGDDHFHDALRRMACCSAPFYTDDGLLGTISLMTDISAAHPHLLALLCTVADYAQRELLLRRQNTRLQILNQVLLETRHYGVIVTDAEGRVLETNDHLQATLRGCGAVPGDGEVCVWDIEELAPSFRNAILRGEEAVGIELKLRREDDFHHYLLDVVPVYDSSGLLIRVVGSLRDITELKTARELLLNAEKLVFAGQLAASIAHEIRNPLTTVKGMLQLSAEKNGGGLLHYDLIMSELERMNLIVSELLLLGKPQAVQYKDESCLAILREVLSVFGIQARMNGIEIVCDTDTDATIRCDRNQIKQVFLNILKNAMDALPYGGRIVARLDLLGRELRIRMTDDGEGMPEEVLRKIGEPFLTTKSDGNGLGMMIVRNIVSAHEGRMEIASKLGEGTQVDVYLPAVPLER